MIKRLLIYLPPTILVLVGLYFIVTTAPSVRLWVDDFCASTLLRNNGFIGAQISWWKSWTGRYSFIALLDLFETLGSWTTRITPFVILPFLVVPLFPVLGALLSFVFVTLALINSPNIAQSFYWQMGSVNYVASFIFLNLFLTQLLIKANKMKIYIAFLLLFIAGGFSEPFALAQSLFLVIIITWVLIIKPKEKKSLLKILSFALLGSIFALVVMRLSPGNVAREATVTRPESLIFVIKSTLLGTKWYLVRLLGIKTFLYSLTALFSGVFLLGRKYVLKSRQAILIMFFSAAGAIILTASVIFTGFYSMSILPPERTLFIAIYFILISFVAFSLAISSLIRKLLVSKKLEILSWGIIFLNIIASALLVKSVVIDWGRVRTEIRDYAKAFDAIEPKLIKSSGKELAKFKNIKPVGELDSFTDNKGWVASCLAGYYKIKNVTIIE